MIITIDRAANGVITIDDGDVSVDYPKPDLRLHYSEKNGDCRIFYGRDLVHVFRLTDEILINGDPFSGDIVELQQTLRSEIFFLAEGEGGGGGSMTPGQIVDALESLTGNQRLAASAIKDLPAGGGASIENAATFSAITGSSSARFVIVAADETNNGDSSLYIHNGSTLIFLFTIPNLI